MIWNKKSSSADNKNCYLHTVLVLNPDMKIGHYIHLPIFILLKKKQLNFHMATCNATHSIVEFLKAISLYKL